MDDRLTLTEAIKIGRLPQFVAKEEARGIGPADPCALDALVAEAAFDEKLKKIARPRWVSSPQMKNDG